MQELTAPIIGINRHRMGTDGVGVTTLVAFHGCPLACRYCLNPQSLRPDGVLRSLTPGDLYAEVEIDDLYFMATGGGICFGGGEPLLQSDFIRAFTEIMNPEWNITLETSLNVPLHQLEKIARLVHLFYIDVKDLNDDIYRAYTGKSNLQLMDNLRWMAAHSLANRVIIRLPLIPHFNENTDRDRSEALLTNMGFQRFDRFDYIMKPFS